jgi:hypothetical protein
MRSIIAIILALISLNASTNTCGITGEYRCRGGRTGTVVGQGISTEEAKNRARDQAREICGGRVDYVRFVENSSTC